MNLIKHELFKAFLNKRILFILASLLVLNGVLLYIQANQQNIEDDPATYRAVYESIEGMSGEDAVALLEKERTELLVIMEIAFAEKIDEEWQRDIYSRFEIEDLASLIEREQQGDFLRYTDGIWNEIDLYEMILNEVAHIHQYDAYLDKIDEDAKRLTSISIFSKADTFSHRNIVKTPEDFAHLKGNTLMIAPSKGVQMATQFGATDILAVLFLLIVVMRLITREKEQQTLGIIKTTYKGRGTLIIAKLSVAVLTSLIVLLSFYAINYLFAAATYGFGPLDRYIQSVKGFLGSPFEISVLQYLSLYLIVKFFVFVLISLLFFMIATITRHSMAVYISIAVVLGMSSIIYYLIPATSYFSFFKYINLYYFLQTSELFAQYINLNLFGYPYRFVYCFIVTMILLLSMMSIISYQVFCKSKQLEGKAWKPKWLQHIRFPQYGHHLGIFRHEAYKLFIVSKVLLVLLVGIAFQYYTYQPRSEEFSSFLELHYKNYMVELEGELTADKETFLLDEEAYFNDLLEEQLELLTKDDVSDFHIAQISEKLRPKEAFNLVLERANYIRMTEAETGVKAWFLYDRGYQLLTAEEGNHRDLQLALLLIILLIACLTPIFTFEMQTKMIRLISPTKHGRKKVFYIKLGLGFLVSSFIYGLIYAPEFYNVLVAYGTHALSAPAISMQHIKYLPFQMTILQYLIFISVLRYVGMIAACFVIYYLSVKLKTLISVALAATAVLAMPILLSMINIHLFDNLLLTPFLIGNTMFTETDFSFLQAYRMIWSLFASAILVVCLGVCFALLRKKYIRYVD